jgi:anti-sigma B factor antagonist
MSTGKTAPEGRTDRPQVLVDARDTATVVALAGEHDVFTAPEVRGRFAMSLEARTPLVIDLSDAAFVDSSILGAVIGAVQRARDEDVGIAVVLPAEGSTTHRIFEITGLLPLMPRAATVDDALDLVRSAPA